MRSELGTWGAVAGMVVIACLFGGLALAIYPGWAALGHFLNANIRLSDHAPAWVQAVGSVAAIAVAIWVPYAQHRRENDRLQAAAVLQAITMSAKLSELQKGLDRLATDAESVFLRLPNGMTVLDAFRGFGSLVYPDLADQFGLTPAGMGYLRKAAAAAAAVTDMRTRTDEMFELWNDGESDWQSALDAVSARASEAATLCHEARMELEDFISRNGIYGT